MSTTATIADVGGAGSGPTRPWRYPVLLLVFFVVRVAIAKLSLMLAFSEGAVAPLWPAAGVSLAVILIGGYRYWPAIALGAFVVVAPGSPGLLAATGVAIGNTLEALVGAYILKNWCGFDARLERVRDAVSLILVGAIAATTISTAAGVFSLCAAGTIPWSELPSAALVWWTGNASGVLIAAPLVLSWGAQPVRRRLSAGQWVEAVLLLLVTAGLAEVVFGLVSGTALAPSPLMFLMVPPLVWAAIRFGVRGASLAGLVICFWAVSATVKDMGPFARSGRTIPESVAILSFFTLAMSGTGLVLSALVDERERAARARQQAEARFATLIEQASDGIFVTDMQGYYQHVNRAGQELLGYSLEELRGLKATDIVVMDVLDSTPLRVTEMRAGKTVLSERRLRRKNGTIVPVEASGKMLSDGMFLGIVRDITERKKAERQRELLVRELDHRVKNNLAVVLSIADQTLRASRTLDEFREGFTGRVLALARVHGLLAQSRWTGTDLRSLVEKTLLPYGGGQIEMDGEAASVPAKATGPLCMALHELATNAVKYGALRDGHGRVRIRWERREDERGTPVLEILWEEKGGPAVTRPERSGFGMQLIENGMAHELGAKVNLEFKAEGLSCSMRLPIEAGEGAPVNAA